MDIAIKQMNDVTATFQRNNEFLESKIKVLQKLQCELQSQIITDTKFLAYSYDFDQEAIKIIGKYFTEFADTAYDYGYVIYLKGECNREVNVYLESMDDNNNLTNCVNALENLMKVKMETEDSSQEVSPAKLDRQLEKLGNKMDKVLEKLNHVPNSNELLKTAENEDENNTRATNFNHQEEFLMTSLNLLEPHPKFLYNVFHRISQYGVKRNIAQLKIHFQQQMSDDKSITTNGVASKSKWNLSGQFSYDTSESMKQQEINSFTTRFSIKNIIGTIHIADIGLDKESGDCLKGCIAFLLFDNKIVKWSFKNTQDEALDCLYSALKADCGWNKLHKFAAKIKVEENRRDYFKYIANEKVYMEGNRLGAWIIRNIHSVNQYDKWNTVESVIDNSIFIYNVFSDYVYELRRWKSNV